MRKAITTVVAAVALAVGPLVTLPESANAHTTVTRVTSHKRVCDKRCAWIKSWSRKGYVIAPRDVQTDPEFRGHGLIMWRVGDTTYVVAFDGTQWVS